MRSLIKVFSALAFVGSIAWFIADRGYEPIITGLGGLATFIGLFLTEDKSENHNIEKSEESQKDEVKAKSIQVVRSISPKLGSLSGSVDIRLPRGAVHEVFYKKYFKRTPHLEIKRGHIGALGTIEIIEQRKDGFKVKSHDYYSVDFKWTAEGEFED